MTEPLARTGTREARGVRPGLPGVAGRPRPPGLSFYQRKWSLGAEVDSLLLSRSGAFPQTDGSPDQLMSLFVGEGFEINNEFN